MNINNVYQILKRLFFAKICLLFVCFALNVSYANVVNEEKYNKKSEMERDVLQIKSDAKIDKERGNKKVKRAKKHTDWNDWHGLKSNKNAKKNQRYSKDEILENELKHYETTRQNVLNAHQRRNYDKRRRQRLEKFDKQTEIQKNEKLKKDDDIKKANGKYIEYKDNNEDNIREIRRKYKNGEYTKVIVTNADKVVKNKINDDYDNKSKDQEDDIEDDENE